MKTKKFRKKRFPYNVIRFFKKTKKSKSGKNSEKIVCITDYQKPSALDKRLAWLEKQYIVTKL